MFSADQLNAKIKKVAQELGVQDVNRVRGIVTLEHIIARIATNSFLMCSAVASSFSKN